MCGILCLITAINSGNISQEVICCARKAGALYRRGPDQQSYLETVVDPEWKICLYSTVLHMRGDLCPQPIQHPRTGDILLWNGEIFGGIEIPELANDGDILMEHLVTCHSKEQILNVFKKIQGPYAFIYIQKSTQTMWFGRDMFGRRSLTFSVDPITHDLYMSSVTLSHIIKLPAGCDWTELAAAGIYRMNFSKVTYEIDCYPWIHNTIEPNAELKANISDCGIGIDKFKALNLEIPVVVALPDQLDIDEYLSLVLNQLSETCEQFLDKLKHAVYRRVGGHSYFCSKCRAGDACSEAHIAVMFSGGIDSMMLAYLADMCVPKEQPIDLLNVAFETGNNCDYEVPDRATGRQALTELSTDRTWNFVEINVTKEELQKVRIERISQLIHPLDSVLDDSIGCAMWFASRGSGFLRDEHDTKISYSSKARVVLSGLGADEQLGGYSRHRSSFQANSFEGLLKEINLDVSRISARNLGRDDRVVSDHGKEARFPFLDEEFVSFLNQLPIDKKMDLRLPRGAGEKLILRTCALKCGLPITARLAKRAIQFGSRIAKCENRKERGSDVCKRLVKGVGDAVS